MKKLLPIILALIGTGAGVGAGIFLAPAHDGVETAEAGHTAEAGAHDEADMHAADEGHGEVDDGHGGTGPQFVKMNNQFVVPVVSEDRVEALVVMSLSLEVPTGNSELVYSREPKLRDAFLQVMFDHANIGGFDGNFTEAHRMQVLRQALKEVARQILGPDVRDVLITEIARQDN